MFLAPVSQKQSKIYSYYPNWVHPPARTCAPPRVYSRNRVNPPNFAMWHKPTAKPTTNAAPATTARLFPLLSHVWLTFRSSDFPVWQPDWVFKQAGFAPNLIGWTRHTRGELGSETSDFLNMRLQGQSVLGRSLETGKTEMRLKDVGVWFPALRLVPSSSVLGWTWWS